MAPRMRRYFEMDDLRYEARGIESLEPLPGGFSLSKNWKAYGERSGTGLRAVNIRSAVSHWSDRLVARWSPGSKRTVGPTVLSGSLSEAHNSFIVTSFGEAPRPELKLAYSWYINFLEFKIKDAWETLFFPVLRDFDPDTTAATRPCNRGLSVAFHILETVVMTLKIPNVALTDIVDKLYNKEILKFTDYERSHAHQLVLASIGWISFLYSARPDPDPKMLQIIDPLARGPAVDRPHTVRRVGRRKVKTFTTYEQTLEDNDQPLHYLLGRFGKIIPQRQGLMISGHITPSLAPIRPDDEWIELSLLCFHTLIKIASIKIEWVDSVSLHLEFDSYTKVLKIFRRPTSCLLSSSCENVSPLSQLFFDATESNNYLSAKMEDASEFYREALLTYRLIFGQDKCSYNDFITVTRTTYPVPKENYDSLLSTLCGESWESPDARQVYELIEAEGSSPHYGPSTHFPFFGKRLLDIQTYVRGHKPSNFREIWYDKRNALTWWTSWAIMIPGGITLILTLIFGILQTVLSIFQVIYAKQQVVLQTVSNQMPLE